VFWQHSTETVKRADRIDGHHRPPENVAIRWMVVRSDVRQPGSASAADAGSSAGGGPSGTGQADAEGWQN